MMSEISKSPEICGDGIMSDRRSINILKGALISLVVCAHLLVFSAIAAVLPKNNRIIVVSVSLLSIVFCLWIFSTDWYRRLFNGALGFIKKAVFKGENK